MHKIVMIFLALLWAPVSLAAMPDMPAGTAWYLHADLVTMRDGAASRELYRWLDSEVFAELREETGIDLGQELHLVTAHSSLDTGLSIVFEGPLSETAQNKMLAIMTLKADPDLREFKGKDYYSAVSEHVKGNVAGPLGPLNNAAFVSFDVPGHVLVTSQESQMHTLLAQNGRMQAIGKHKGALLVLTADRTLLQAGVRPEAIGNSADDWDSNILRNAEQIALLMADQDGKLAIEAQLKARDPRLTESLGNVISGLISLQAFNSELDPELRALLANTRVSARDALLNVTTLLDPADLLRLLAD